MNAAPSDLPARLRARFGRLLGTVLNRAVQLDPAMPAQLAALEGRSLEFRLSAPTLAFVAHVRAGRFEIGPVQDANRSDLSLSSSLGAVFSKLLPRPQGSRSSPGRMHISGDAELAQHLQSLMKRYDPDIEGLFVSLFGEVVGVQLAQGMRNGLERLRAGGLALARDSAQFLGEERRDLVPRAELAAFAEDVQELQDAVERLERRLQRQGMSAT